MKLVSEFCYKEQASSKWRFVLVKDVVIDCGKDLGIHNFCDIRGISRATVDGNIWTIKAGYAWDGSSPKAKILGTWVGTPDFKSTRLASCWHDSAGQFRHLLCIDEKLEWKTWNKMFADLILSQGGKIASPVYYAGLLIGNMPYQLIGKLFGSKATGYCEVHR